MLYEKRNYAARRKVNQTVPVADGFASIEIGTVLNVISGQMGFAIRRIRVGGGRRANALSATKVLHTFVGLPFARDQWTCMGSSKLGGSERGESCERQRAEGGDVFERQNGTESIEYRRRHRRKCTKMEGSGGSYGYG